MANNLAYGALIAWPLVALVLYLTMSAGRATIWTILAGYLLLPQSINFNPPGLPVLDKASIPNIVALILAPLMARAGEFRWPRSMTVNLLMLVHVLGGFVTAITNSDPIVIGTITIPPHGWGQAVQVAANRGLEIVPFLLGAALLGTERGHRQVLMAFVIAALAYSLPMLAEIRLSPFIQQRVYGIIDVNYFIQQMRGGGFRSMVFLGHGLLTSMVIAMAVIASIGLARMRVRLFGMPFWLVTLYLAVILLLNKSIGATILAGVIGLLLWVLTPRRFVTAALAVAALIVTYPAVRSAGLIPYEQILTTAQGFNEERGHSLQTRLRNEEILLDRAEQRPFFGWGGYGRNRVYRIDWKGDTGDASVTDGTWIIVIGMYGWVGYISFFGLLTYPIWNTFRQRASGGLSMATVTLVAMLVLNLLDIIPNSSLRPITWLAAGALASLAVARNRLPRRAARRIVQPPANVAVAAPYG